MPSCQSAVCRKRIGPVLSVSTPVGPSSEQGECRTGGRQVRGPRTAWPNLVGMADSISPIRTLLLMRHAKSGYPDGVADHDRPLAARGIREAGLAGDWIRANFAEVDAVLCST